MTTTIRFAAAAAFAVGLGLAGPAVLAPSEARADVDPVYTGFLSSAALGGYDAVAYFTDGAPIEGSSEFTAEYNGATWYFASAENRETFLANPEAYVPQYGGYCAWAVSQGYTAKGDPDHWSIVDGKLYLNYNADVQARWEKDIPGHISAGDQNWPEIVGN